ncbi:MAG: alpha-2-macroglobulin family protein [Bryobacteraceae bacterium]|nr:alpha-2-macroglobulin family protein [Bryobacteraceae bacterium]
MRRLLGFLLVGLLLAPVRAQDDEVDGPGTYFSLAVNRTFGPGEKPVVQLYGRGLEVVEMRVYRINSPVKFFQTLEEAHRFGTPPQQARESGTEAKTPLERFHRFKRRTQTWVRNVVRAQFTGDARAEIRTALYTPAAKKAAGPAKVNYAAVPVLNPEQLVSTWQQPLTRTNPWEASSIPVETPGKGVYVVEATDGTLRAFTLVQVSELVVLTKGAAGKMVARVVRRDTGEGVPDCAVSAWSKKLQLARMVTESDGRAEFEVSGADLGEVLVLAKKGDDFAASAAYGYGLGGDGERNWQGYVYTDRPVYRPGHDVKFRAVVRAQMGAGYKIPAAREVSVDVQDAEGNSIGKQTLAMSAMGTVNGGFKIPETAALGYYQIEIKSGAATVSGNFQVEEYRKPEYEVKVIPAKRRVLQGESVEVQIEARYYFGEPVANAKVKYAVHKTRYWHPAYAEELDEGEGEPGGESDWVDEQAEEKEGTLDAEGRLRVPIETRQDGQDARYRIEARVTDDANREVAGTGWVLATVGSFLVHAQPAQYVVERGERAKFVVETQDYDGKPVSTDFTARVQTYQWNRGGGRQVYEGSGRTDAQGRGAFEFTVEQAGSYLAEVRARTPEAREVRDTAHLWVSGPGTSWGESRQERLQIVTDKKSYQAGETARLLIVTGAPKASLLIGYEGKDLFGTQTLNIEGPSTTIDVPIRNEYAPNFFVSVTFLRNGQLYQGLKNIKVPPVEQQLTVSLTSSKAEYKPGEPAMFTLEARDHTGRAANAEFSLGVVDEAIYAVRREMLPEILNFFYGRSWNRVTYSSSLSYYFQGEAGKRPMQLARLKSPSLAQLKPERLVDPSIRKAFPDTAFWAASLRTDGNGRASAQFSFPDALTTWRATARGVTEDTMVGSAVHRVTVRKNLILRLTTPRFLREGDEVTVSALVQNYLSEAKKARVSLDVQGLDVIEGGVREVDVPSKGTAKVDYRLKARPGTKAVLLGKALTNEESDALELTVPVQPFGVKLADARAGSIATPSGESAASLVFPEKSVTTSRALEISVTPSIAGTLFGALEYLTGFPYGCVEQTMSSFVPNIVVSQTLQGLNLKSKVDPAELRKMVRAGVERLQGFQHEDGGWGWWTSDESHPFMTPYVVAGLAQAQKAGFTVNTDAMDRGAEWIRKNIDGKDTRPDQRAYMAYAVALKGESDRGLVDKALAARSGMTAYGLAFLGLTLRELKDGRAEEIASQLEGMVQQNEVEAWWPSQRDQLLDFEVDATPETTAYAMKFLTAMRPQSGLLGKAAAWLVNHRRDGQYWSSTKQTAMVIYGVTDYLKVGGELKPNSQVTVTVNGRQVISRKFTEADALAPGAVTLKLGPAEIGGARADIRVSKSGEGRVYWSARASYYSTEESMARGDAGMAMTREYFKLAAVKTGDKVVHELQPLAGSVAPGDTVAVRLSLKAPGQRYLMVEDPIPAGAELIERDQLYEIKDRPRWWGYYYTRRELRDDRVALFQTYVDGREDLGYVYLMKIVNPGVFRVSPGRAEPMYRPGTMATTASRVMEVRQP